MQTLINDLLQYSRIATRAQPFVRVDLNSMLCELISDLEVRIESSRGRIVFDALPVIHADTAQIRQLMQNLIGNALKYHRPDVPPVVTVAADVLYTPEERAKNGTGRYDSVRITITDNGIGFDNKYSEQIFAIFHRLHGRSEYEGTGIGLAICKKIVDRHGGMITANGTPDEGAVFMIDLPYLDVATPARPETAAAVEESTVAGS
jgi:light-regulated signal transduction histidine kinase (bacteriophytochrome)